MYNNGKEKVGASRSRKAQNLGRGILEDERKRGWS